MNALDTLDVAEAANYLKCSESTIRNKVANGELSAAKIGKQYVFLRGELIDFIKGSLKSKQGNEKCQYLSAKVHPITTTSSTIKDADIVLAQALKTVKKRNR